MTGEHLRPTDVWYENLTRIAHLDNELGVEWPRSSDEHNAAKRHLGTQRRLFGEMMCYFFDRNRIRLAVPKRCRSPDQIPST